MSKPVMAVVALLAIFILAESSTLKKYTDPDDTSRAGREVRGVYSTCKWCSILLLGLCVYHLILMIVQQWK